VRIIAKEVIVSVDSSGNFQYSLAPETDYEVHFEKEGFLDKVVEISTKGLAQGDLSLNAVLHRLLPDTALYRVFYDYNDAFVRGEAYHELDKVIDFLKRNPTVKLRLVSHSDSRGTNSYNEELSRKRTLSAYAYLLKNGIDKSRLEQVWVGESRPVNDCIDGKPCTEEEYRLNRQTEIRYGGRVSENELPRIEATYITTDSASTPATGKEAIKEKGGKSGKEKIKEKAEPTGKEEIKEEVKTEPVKGVTPAIEPVKEETPAEPVKEEKPADPQQDNTGSKMAPVPTDSVKTEPTPVVPEKQEAPAPEDKMVEELKKEGTMLQDFDAPKDTIVPPVVAPEKGTEDGKPN